MTDYQFKKELLKLSESIKTNAPIETKEKVIDLIAVPFSKILGFDENNYTIHNEFNLSHYSNSINKNVLAFQSTNNPSLFIEIQVGDFKYSRDEIKNIIEKTGIDIYLITNSSEIIFFNIETQHNVKEARLVFSLNLNRIRNKRIYELLKFIVNETKFKPITDANQNIVQAEIKVQKPIPQDVSVFRWFFLFCLLLIPGLNILLIILLAILPNKTKSLTNWARATIIWLLILPVFYGILVSVFGFSLYQFFK